MKSFITVIVLVCVVAVLASCGMKQKVSGKVDVSGTVEHRLSLAELTEYFRVYCESVDADKGGIPNANAGKDAEEVEVEPSPEPDTVGDVIDEQGRVEECIERNVRRFMEAVS